MSDAVAVPTIAERLGIKVRSRKRVRKPGPPRDWRHLMAALCYLTLIIIVAARGANGVDVVVIGLFGVLAGVHLRRWVGRAPMDEREQLIVLAGIIAQVILVIF